jgi:light-regulated signal transduction histidine kinase (bacteriophytochrome)
VISVQDNGTGFDMRYYEKIFEIFQRLQRAEDYPGTGVGLALVRKAIERMGGRVWAESSPGKGATFHLELDLALDTAEFGA